MIVSKDTIEKIKKIVSKNYQRLTLSLLGTSVLTDTELRRLSEQGVDVTDKKSLLELAYNHNFINEEGSTTAPTSLEDMESQQSIPNANPEGEAHQYAIEHANENMEQLLHKMQTDVSTKLESLIRDSNNQYKSNALQNLDRPDSVDELIKEGMVGQIKQKLRDTAKDANRDWTRIATTEISNVIGIASTDRIVAKNQNKELSDVYVFRTVVNDSKLCKYCKEFYLDSDGSPKVYKLSTLLSNGSNYGKKTVDWKPTIQATHPNERCSQVIELPPGYKVLSGGKLTYIGVSAWNEYIVNKVSS